MWFGGGTVLTGGTHGSVRTDERTGFCADERAHGTARESTRTRRSVAPTSRSHLAARERERERGESGRGLAPTCGDHLSEEGGRAHAGLKWAKLGWLGRNEVFYFP
jgi:hypothetical protein